jgi:hypothetical protein
MKTKRKKKKVEPWPCGGETETRGQDVVMTAIYRMEGCEDAEQMIEDVYVEVMRKAAALVQYMLINPLETQFTYGKLLNHSLYRQDPNVVLPAINLLLRLGILEVTGINHDGYDRMAFGLVARYDPLA